MLALLAQKPIVVDLSTKSEQSRDISIEVVLSMFAVAGIFLTSAGATPPRLQVKPRTRTFGCKSEVRLKVDTT